MMKTFNFLAVGAALLLPLYLPAQSPWKTVAGKGPVVKEELALDAFHSIGLGIAGTVYLQPGQTQKVVVEAQQNIIDLLKREVKNGLWNIGFENTVSTSAEVNIYITLPVVRSLSIGGSGKIVTTEAFRGLGVLSFSIGGSGSIEFSGEADVLEASIGGSGNVKAANLRVHSGKISIGGSGNCYVEASERIDVSIAGSGSVLYKGRPRVHSSIAGSGRVRTMY